MSLRSSPHNPSLARAAAVRASAVGLLLSVALGGCFPRGFGDQGSAPWLTGGGVPVAYVLHTGPGRFAVVVDTDDERPPAVEWRRADGRAAARSIRARRVAGLWVVRLGPFAAGQRITYRVVADRARGAATTFRAGAAPGRVFRFAVFGDTRNNHVVHWNVVRAVARENVDFFINTGDLVQYGMKNEWHRFLAIERSLMERSPVYAVVGNHDVSSKGYFRRLFMLDAGLASPRYYARDWGDVRVVILDSEVELRPGSAQYRFADEQLAAAARRGMLIVLAIHVPPYSSGVHGSNLKIRRVIQGFVSRHGIELIVSGHDHNYERIKVQDGATYIVSGSAGAPIRSVEPRSFSAKVRLEPHYVLVDVDRGGMTLRAVNLYGVTFDSWVIRPNPPMAGK